MMLKLRPEGQWSYLELRKGCSRQRDSMCKGLEVEDSLGLLRDQMEPNMAGVPSASGPFEGKGMGQHFFLSLNWAPLHLLPASSPPHYRKMRQSHLPN